MTTVHCPSCDGYQTAVMDDGQRSVGVCEGVASRAVETAEEWEYGDGRVHRGLFTARADSDEAPSFQPAPEGMTTGRIRRRPAVPPGAWEPVPPTPEEADSEEVRRLAAKIIARDKPLLDRLAAHDGPEEGDRGQD